jgi:biopolymer transport protein ExbB/TolQ
MSTQPSDIANLITSVKESLEREIHSLGEGLFSRFDIQAARRERQGALIQTESRWTARMNDWADKVDSALEEKDKQIAELAARLAKLEKANGH